MAGKPGKLWSTPGLSEYVCSLYAEGVTARGIIPKVAEKFRLSLTIYQVQNHAQGKGVTFGTRVPLSLIEPAQGYAVSDPVPPKFKHPTGWEPHVEIDGAKAIAVSEPVLVENPDHEWLIKGWGLDPSRWRIVGTLKTRRWQTDTPIEKDSTDCRCDPKQSVRHHEKRWSHYYRAELEQVDPSVVEKTDALLEEIRKHKPRKVSPPGGDLAFFVALADTQMGKADGDGTEGIIQRCLERIDRVEARIHALRQSGYKLGTLYLAGMGDLVESCGDFYEQQTWKTQLNRRDQVKVMRRLVVKALERWTPLFPRAVVTAVGGNHGENRRNGKSFTDFADNDDVAIFEQVEEILSANPSAYGHVKFRIPKDDLSLCFDVHGVPIGITHGHVAGKGSGRSEKKMLDWWAKQAHGQQPVGDAQILVSAHYHSFARIEDGRKTWLQCPTLDGGSEWFRNQSGKESRPGLLTFVAGESAGDGRGIEAVEVL